MSDWMELNRQITSFEQTLSHLQPQTGFLGGRFFVSHSLSSSKKWRFNELIVHYRQLFDSMRGVPVPQGITGQTILSTYHRLKDIGGKLGSFQNAQPRHSFHFSGLLTKIRRWVGNYFFSYRHSETRDQHLQRTSTWVQENMDVFNRPLPQPSLPSSGNPPTASAAPPSSSHKSNLLSKPPLVASPQTPAALLKRWRDLFMTVHTKANHNKSALQLEMMQIQTALVKQGFGPEKRQEIEKEERLTFLNRALGLSLTRADDGAILIAHSPQREALLKRRKIEFKLLNHPSSALRIEAKGESALFEAMAKASIAQEIVSIKLMESFHDEEGSWGVILNKQEVDSYCLGIEKPSLRKYYSLFAFLRELGLISWKECFDPKKPLPVLTEENLMHIKTFFEAQEKFSSRIKQLFQEIDKTAGAFTGSESTSNFYVTSLQKGLSDEQFVREFNIPKAVVNQIRQETGFVIYPAAVQIQTKSDEIMYLLEKYYRDFGFKDRKGGDKTFIIETRPSGMVHKSNINVLDTKDFPQLNDKLLFLISAKKICQFSTLGDIVRQEFAGKLNQDIRVAIRGKFFEFFFDSSCTLPVEKKQQLVDAIAEAPLPAPDASNKIEAAVMGEIQKFITAETALGKKSCTFYKTQLDIKEINQLVYPQGRPSSDALRLKRLEQLLKEEALLTNLKNQLTAFLSVAANTQNITRDNIDLLEQCVYRLKKRDLPPERYRNFAAGFNDIDWKGCAAGFRIKLTELCQKLIPDESIDSLLLARRNELVTVFSAMKYNGANEGVMYLGGFQKALNQEFGLLEKDPTAAWYSSNNREREIQEARSYLLEHYTPSYIYKVMRESFVNRIKEAIATDLSHEVDKVLSELGVKNQGDGEKNPMNRYYNEIDGSFDESVIHFDLPFLVLNYCISNRYLSWKGAKESSFNR